MEINEKHTIYLPGRSVQEVTVRESRRQLEANYPGAIYLLTADNITRTTKPWKQCSANWLRFIKNNRYLETAAVITLQMKMQISYWKSLTTCYLWQNNTLPRLCSREWSVTSMYCLWQVGTMLYNYNFKWSGVKISKPPTKKLNNGYIYNWHYDSMGSLWEGL